ncbi:MAG: mannosyltransferase family protein [Baekduiaceae bacterium]
MTPDGTPATPRRPALHRVRAALDTPAWRDALFALWTSRLLVLVAGIVAAAAFGFSARAEDFDPAGYTIGLGSVADVVVAPFARWDSVWFLSIAGDGYDDGARAAFFPLYPVLVGALGTVLGSDLVAGVVVSLVALTAALVALHRLTALDFGDGVARGAVLAVAFFPMSFFLSAVYSEALYLALSVGSFLAARTGRWAWVGVLGGCAAATRSAGIVLLLPLVIIWCKQRDRRPADLAWLALVPAGRGGDRRGGGGRRPRPARAVRRPGGLVPLVRRAVRRRVGRRGRRVAGRPAVAVGRA